MNKYNFAIRLRAMLNKECDITIREAAIAKRNAKSINETYELKRILDEQDQELEMFRKENEKLKSNNQKLENGVQANERRLAAITKNIKELEKEYEIELPLRKGAQMKMALLHEIKQTTQTCFNMNALPNRFEGAIHIEDETSWEWIPFAQDVKEWINFLEEQFENIKNPETFTESQNMTPIV